MIIIVPESKSQNVFKPVFTSRAKVAFPLLIPTAAYPSALYY